MNVLCDLIRQRSQHLQQHGISINEQAERGGWVKASTLHYYLARHEPFDRTPRDNVLHQLAQALDLPVERLREAAVLSLLDPHPTDLQRLLRTRQAKLGLRTDELAEVAGIHPGTLQQFLNGDRADPSPATIAGLSRAFHLPRKRIEEAAAQRVDYRLPPHLAARMTPEKWEETLRVIEAMLT